VGRRQGADVEAGAVGPTWAEVVAVVDGFYAPGVLVVVVGIDTWQTVLA
jgi:hypothetical protein